LLSSSIIFNWASVPGERISNSTILQSPDTLQTLKMEIAKKSLTDFIQHIFPIADNVVNLIVKDFEKIVFTKSDFLLKDGQVCNDFLFLEKGFLRAFTFDTKGNEVTTNFYRQNSIVFEVASYFKRIPTQENIQALTDCGCWKINYDTFQNLFHSIPEFREFGRTNLVNGFIALKERTLSMINSTAEQRYEHLLNSRSDIFQNVPLKYIASYLGITDTSLSRIRKEIMQK
jgi:CRP-like cAMP-binding protein